MTDQLILPFEAGSIESVTPRLPEWFDYRSFDAFGTHVIAHTGLCRVSFDLLMYNSRAFNLETRRVLLDTYRLRDWALFISLESFLAANFDTDTPLCQIGPKRREFLRQCQTLAANALAPK